MTDLISFSFDGSPVRAVIIDGVPHLVGADVAARLGYAHPANAIARHCRGAPKKFPLATAGGIQDVRVLSEPDICRLIVRSKLPEAQEFERVVFEEILPSVRRTGSYSKSDPMVILSDPNALRGLLGSYVDRVIKLEADNAVLAPKAAAMERLEASEGSCCITDAAKTLGIPPRKLFEQLDKKRWIYRRTSSGPWVAFQRCLDQGMLEHRVHVVKKPDGTDAIREQVAITSKGLAKLAEILAGVEVVQ